jgi:8-oxo-dGTP diphosphatase
MTAIQNIKVAVDAVVFGYNSSNGLSVLLIKRDIEPFKNSWALPGGLVQDLESLEEAVVRELHEETSVSIDYLEQLYSFGEPNRDPRNRVVSVTYYGLVSPDKFKPQANTDAQDAKWFLVSQMPPLAFDHGMIIEMAIKRLKSKITYEPIGFELLGEKFPFSDLEKLYTTLLDRPIDRRNFKKKIMQYDFVEETTEKQAQEGAGRPGNLYRFNEEKYFEHKQKGINFEI